MGDCGVDLTTSPREDRIPSPVAILESLGHHNHSQGAETQKARWSAVMVSENSLAPAVEAEGGEIRRKGSAGWKEGLTGEEREGGSWGPVGGAIAPKASDLDDKFRHLNLRAEGEEDVILEEDLEELEKDEDFMALARVHTTRKFSHNAFYRTLRSA